MKNKLFLLISVGLIVVGAALGYFAQFEVAKLTGFAVTMFGAGLLVAKTWKDRAENSNKVLVVLSMVFVGIGAFIAGVSGVIVESQVTAIISCVFSLILVIAGIITSVLSAQKK